jgi:uncharacterized coiled-coil DUF342 family protein
LQYLALLPSKTSDARHPQYYNEIEDLRARRAAANAKLAELKEASDDMYREMIANMDSMRASIDSAMKSAIAKFN